MEVAGNKTDLLLPVRPLESGRVALPQVGLDPDVDLLEPLDDLLDGVVDLLPRLLRQLDRQPGRDDDDLRRSDPRGRDHAEIVSVRHDHDTDAPRRETPRVLPDVQDAAPLLRVLHLNVEHPGEILAETVRGRGLNTSPSGGDEALDGRGEETAGELLVLRLDALDHGDGEELLVNAAVEFEDLVDLLLGLSTGHEGGVALLPEELASPKERLCVEGTKSASHCKKKKSRNDERGFLNSHRTTLFHWLRRRGRSR